MKNETARREIESLDYYLQNHTDDYSEESHTAMMMAIKALEQEPCEDEYIKVPKKALKYRTAGMVAYNAEWLKNHFDIERVAICGTQQPCEDVISRQAVLDGLASIAKAKAKSDAQKSLMGRVMFFVEQLPSVNPQPCEDVIRRQDVLDLAKKGVLISNGNYESVCKAINELPSVTQKSDNKYRKKAKRWKNKWLKLRKSGKWIPVSERLPDKDRKHKTFLVTDKDGNLSISKFYLPLSNSAIDQPYWSGMIDVIAWMPLPEPYKAQESEDKE